MMKGMIYFLVLPVILKVEVATSQHVLVVELTQFYNMYDVEVINGQYCCCDKNEKCASNPEDLTNCKSKCDTWFNITLTPCRSPYSCSAATVAHCNSASLHYLDYKFEFLIRNSSDTNVTLTINAWDRQKCQDQEIDSINRSFPLLATNQRQKFRDNGANAVGEFTFAYQVQKVFNECEVCTTEVLPTVDNSTCVSDTTVVLPPVDNSTCGSDSSAIETASSWSWTAVAIVFMLLTALLFIVSTILACIVRKQKSDGLKVRKSQHGTTRTCTSGSPSNAANQTLPNGCSSLYSEVSLTNDQHSRSTATAKQGNPYDIPMPLLMFDGGTDDTP